MSNTFGKVANPSTETALTDRKSSSELATTAITDLFTFGLLPSSLPRPPLSFPVRVMPCYVSPLCPNLWPLGFEERQRWPLKMATAKFVWGHSHECTSLLSAALTSSYPPPATLPILLLLHPPPPPPRKLTRTRSCPRWGPLLHK